MAEHLKLRIPSACKEEWKGMTPGAGGRFCASCRKEVVDFTAMSDAEILRFFQKSRGGTCGRFSASQLDRDLPIPHRAWPWVHTVFRFTLPAFLLSLKSSAQERTLPAAAIVITPHKFLPATAGEGPAPVHIRGRILTAQGFPMAGASVMVKGSSIGTSTDSEGRFTLTVPTEGTSLTISYVGFVSREVAASTFIKEEEVSLKLEAHLSELMGEVVVVRTVRPARKRPARRKEMLPEEQKVAEATIRAYPNPVPAGFDLRLQCNRLEAGNYKAEVFSPAGVLMRSEALTNFKKEENLIISMEGLLPGNYFLRLTHQRSGKFFSQEIIVSH